MSPQASVGTIIPTFTYLAAWYVLAGAVYYFLGIENQPALDRGDRPKPNQGYRGASAADDRLALRVAIQHA